MQQADLSSRKQTPKTSNCDNSMENEPLEPNPETNQNPHFSLQPSEEEGQHTENCESIAANSSPSDSEATGSESQQGKLLKRSEEIRQQLERINLEEVQLTDDLHQIENALKSLNEDNLNSPLEQPTSDDSEKEQLASESHADTKSDQESEAFESIFDLEGQPLSLVETRVAASKLTREFLTNLRSLGVEVSVLLHCEDPIGEREWNKYHTSAPPTTAIGMAHRIMNEAAAKLKRP